MTTVQLKWARAGDDSANNTVWATGPEGATQIGVYIGKPGAFQWVADFEPGQAHLAVQFAQMLAASKGYDVEIPDGMGTGTIATPDLLTTAYIVKGFWSKAQEINLDPSNLDIEGEIGLQQYLIDCERHDTAVFAEHTDGVDYVWAYEISEPFGEWIAEHAMMRGQLPNADQCITQLRHLLEQAENDA